MTRFGVVADGRKFPDVDFAFILDVAGSQFQSNPTKVTSAPQISYSFPQSQHPSGRGNMLKIF